MVPINVVAVSEVTPVNVVTVAPNDTEVLPIVTALLARELLGIDDPVVKIVPVESGSVSVRSAVASAAVRVIS